MKDEGRPFNSSVHFRHVPLPRLGTGLGYAAEVLGFAQRYEKQRGAHHDRPLSRAKLSPWRIRKIALPRPLPHDLLCNLLKRIDAVVHKLVVHTLKEDVFHAYLLVQAQGQSFYLDCRPSDGMIVATLLGVPLFLTPEVMEAAGQPLEHSDRARSGRG